MTERYEVINREEGSYPISSMCRWSRVSKSGYYSWRDRPQSQTAIRREELAMMIKDVFERSDGTYGYRRIQVVLERRGVRADGSTIRSIMRDLGLQAAQPRAKVRTTVPAKSLMVFVPRWGARGCAGTTLGQSRSTLRSRTRESTGWCIPRRTRQSRILPHGSS